MIELPYGQTHIDFQPPPNGKVFAPKKTKPVSNPTSYARKKIKDYFEKNRSFFVEHTHKKVCLVLSDNTRYAFNNIITPLLLKELEDVEIKRSNITTLIACGLHAPMNRRDLIEDIGQDIVENYTIRNHDADGDLVDLGATSAGTPVLLNKGFMEADLKIATGSVVPHFHAGFGGGYKSILPGISGRLAILKNHSCDMIARDRARYGFLDGNPIYEDIVEAGRKSGLDFIVNSTVDSKKKMTHLLIGEPWETHRKAAKAVEEDMKVTYDKQFDVVVTSNGGYPLDRNLYQCVKGLAVGELMVKDGGSIILASECRDGVGHQVFEQYMSYGSNPEDILGKLKKDEPVADQDNIQILARILTRAKVYMVTSGVKGQTIRAMKMQHASTIEQALSSCAAPREARIAIVPGGPYVLPVRAV